MKVDEIKLWYEYNFWANARILETAAKVSEEQYVATTDFGKLREILVHTLDSAWTWRRVFQNYFVPLDPATGKPPAGEAKMWIDETLTETDLPTLTALKARWLAEEQTMRTYLDSLTDQDLKGIVRYGTDEGNVRERVLWHCLLHVVNHGTQHRSEVAAILTNFGQSPGGLDFTAFLNQHPNLAS